MALGFGEVALLYVEFGNGDPKLPCWAKAAPAVLASNRIDEYMVQDLRERTESRSSRREDDLSYMFPGSLKQTPDLAVLVEL